MDIDIAQTIALSAGLAWASGLRLYLVLFLAGLLSHFGVLALPQELAVLRHPLVLGTSGVMLVAEFAADKVPAFDSLWDSIQTFIRVPAGALLAAFALGDVGAAQGEANLAIMLAAGLAGGTLTAGTHLAKSGGRLALNSSPEPFSNWAASFGEDVLVLAGLWLMVQHPLVFLGCLFLFVLFLAWLLPRLWRFVRGVLRRIGGLLARLAGRGAEDVSTPRV